VTQIKHETLFRTQYEKLKLEEALKRQKKKAVSMLLRALNYVEGYMHDYEIRHRIFTEGNPVILVIEIWWKKKKGYQLPLQEPED